MSEPSERFIICREVYGLENLALEVPNLQCSGVSPQHLRQMQVEDTPAVTLVGWNPIQSAFEGMEHTALHDALHDDAGVVQTAIQDLNRQPVVLKDTVAEGSLKAGYNTTFMRIMCEIEDIKTENTPHALLDERNYLRERLGLKTEMPTRQTYRFSFMRSTHQIPAATAKRKAPRLQSGLEQLSGAGRVAVTLGPVILHRQVR